MLSLAGLLTGLVLFVWMAYRGCHLILAAMAGSCVMFLFSGISVWEGMTAVYLPGMAAFLEQYFLLFLMSALMGRLMSDSGCAGRISLSLAAVIRSRKKNQKFYCAILAPVLYFVLCYGGISGFVVIFTVVPIARDLFRETDTPWRLYCCAGAQSIGSSYLAGSLQAANVYAGQLSGAGTTGGWQLSVLATVVFWAVLAALIWKDVQKAAATGEGFLPSGQGISGRVMCRELSEKELPGLLISMLPLAVVLILSAVFQAPVELALLAGCAVAVLAGGRRFLPELKSSLSAGTVSVYGPILSVSAAYALGAVIQNIEGFAYLEQMLAALPHLAGGTVMGLLTSFVMASASAPIPAFGEPIMERLMMSGLGGGTAQRLMILTTFTSIAPHNAGISNAASVLGLSYRECLRWYIRYTYIPGAAALLAAIVCCNFC